MLYRRFAPSKDLRMRTGDDCRLLKFRTRLRRVRRRACARRSRRVARRRASRSALSARAYRTMGVGSAPLARTREEYVAAAVRLGREPDYRRALVDEIVKRRALVFEREQAVAEFSDFTAQAIESVRSL